MLHPHSPVLLVVLLSLGVALLFYLSLQPTVEQWLRQRHKERLARYVNVHDASESPLEDEEDTE